MTIAGFLFKINLVPTKRSHLNTILFIIIFLLLFPLAISPQEKLPLAVMDFKITNVPGDEVDLLIDFLNNALFDTGVFDVVQRSRREMLVSELEFSYSDIADSEKTRQIGKLLASKLLLFGSIGKIGSRLLFNITTVDVETGKTVSAYSKTYTSLEDIIGDFVQIAGDVAHGSLKAMFLKKASMLYSEDFKKREWLETDKLFYQNNRYHIHSPDEDWYTWQREPITTHGERKPWPIYLTKPRPGTFPDPRRRVSVSYSAFRISITTIPSTLPGPVISAWADT